MRKMFAGLTVAAFVVALMAAPAFAKTETVKGQIVDHDLLQEGQGQHRRRPQDAGRTRRTARSTAPRRAQPLALLTADGKVYQIAGGLAADKNAKLIAHISHTVEVTGDVTEKDGKMMITADPQDDQEVARRG